MAKRKFVSKLRYNKDGDKPYKNSKRSNRKMMPNLGVDRLRGINA